MRYRFIVGMGFLALPFLIATSLYIAISLAISMTIGAELQSHYALRRAKATRRTAVAEAYRLGLKGGPGQ